jgi:hypothetical protein
VQPQGARVFSARQGRVIFTLRDDHGPNGVTFTYAYDPAFPNHVTAITAKDPNTNNQNDPHWQSWRYEYYEAGSLAPGALYRVKRLRADGVTLDLMATYTYGARGQILTSTDAGGGVTQHNVPGFFQRANVTKVR